MLKPILSEFDKDIERTLKEIQTAKDNKEAQFKKNCKTLRKLPPFGWHTTITDFEWPLEEDLLAMPKNEPIKVINLNWKKNTYYPK